MTTTDRMTRRRLPDRRGSLTHKFAVGGYEGYVTVGLFEDGTPGEVFITMALEATPLAGVLKQLAIAVSLGLQSGVPLAVFVDKFSHTRFEPSGVTGNRDIPIAKSVVDYIFRWMGLEFISRDQQSGDGKRPHRIDGET